MKQTRSLSEFSCLSEYTPTLPYFADLCCFKSLKIFNLFLFSAECFLLILIGQIVSKYKEAFPECTLNVTLKSSDSLYLTNVTAN